MGNWADCDGCPFAEVAQAVTSAIDMGQVRDPIQLLVIQGELCFTHDHDSADCVCQEMDMNREDLIDVVLSRLDDSISEQWAKPVPGTATRCAIVEDLLPAHVAHQIFEAFPKDAEGFRTLKSFREHKRQAFDLSGFPRILTEITYALQDQRVVERMGDLTGIADLDGDPTLYAGGLSMMFPGQFLNPHVDNSHEASKSKYRRINTLFYVTPDWEKENGGNLELWDEAVSVPHTVVSKFNRLVFMETNRKSWHSVSRSWPDRLGVACPTIISRLSHPMRATIIM